MEIQSANLQHHALSHHVGGSRNFSQYNIKATAAYFCAVTIVLAAFSYVLAALTHGNPLAESGYLFVLIFLFAGIAHVFIFPRWLSHLHISATFLGGVLLGILVALALLFTFNIAAFQGSHLAFPAAVAFVLPAAGQLCWYYFSGIQVIYEADWIIPADAVPEKSMSLVLNSLPFKVKIKMNAADTQAIMFNVALTDKLTVAAMFCRFLYDREGRIEVVDQNDRQYAWRFYVSGWLGKRALDPEKSLKLNSIKQGDIILIERINR